ncbi:MAG TPA: GNAT family N-acetyltransferase [bacterium]|nr:GNAT family N-acetyltransferase [bacterium]
MPPPVLRPAAAADLEEVAEVFLASRRDALPYLPELHTNDETRRWIAHRVFRDGGMWVAVADGRILGFAALNAARNMLDHLYVRPGCYGGGVGSALLARAKELSAGRLRLFTFQRNVRARAFYEARGFAVVDLNDGSRNEEGEPDVLYEWVRSNET